jgi:hypothetical protein
MIVCMSGGNNRSSCKDTSSALLRVTVTALERGEERATISIITFQQLFFTTPLSGFRVRFGGSKEDFSREEDGGRGY